MTKDKSLDNNEGSFESEVFYSLKSYGYLFPENARDVARFEELYGSTEIDVPLNFEPSLPNLRLDPNPEFFALIASAAFAPTNNNSFILPDDKDL